MGSDIIDIGLHRNPGQMGDRMKSLNLSYDDQDFEKMKANKKHSKMKWEEFIFKAAIQYEMQSK